MSNEMALEDAVMLLRNNNINCALEFTQDKESYLIFNVRGTPWSNSANAGNMILVADYDLEDAIVRLAECVERREWVPVNWRVRLDEPGVYAPGRSWVVLKNARRELEKLTEDVEPKDRTKHTRKDSQEP